MPARFDQLIHLGLKWVHFSASTCNYRCTAARPTLASVTSIKLNNRSSNYPREAKRKVVFFAQEKSRFEPDNHHPLFCRAAATLARRNQMHICKHIAEKCVPQSPRWHTYYRGGESWFCNGVSFESDHDCRAPVINSLIVPPPYSLSTHPSTTLLEQNLA